MLDIRDVADAVFDNIPSHLIRDVFPYNEDNVNYVIDKIHENLNWNKILDEIGDAVDDVAEEIEGELEQKYGNEDEE